MLSGERAQIATDCHRAHGVLAGRTGDRRPRGDIPSAVGRLLRMDAAQEHLTDDGSGLFDEAERAAGFFDRFPKWSEYFARFSTRCRWRVLRHYHTQRRALFRRKARSKWRTFDRE